MSLITLPLWEGGFLHVCELLLTSSIIICHQHATVNSKMSSHGSFQPSMEPSMMLVEQHQQPGALLRYTTRGCCTHAFNTQATQTRKPFENWPFPSKKKKKKCSAKERVFSWQQRMQRASAVTALAQRSCGCLPASVPAPSPQIPGKAHRDEIRSLIRCLGFIREVFGA